MEIIPINDSKLKIMLDECDMKELHICDDADCAKGETRLAIRALLERAKTEIGFNTEGSEIFVQLYTSKGGGCELFITKGSTLPLPAPREEVKDGSKQKKREGQAKRKPQEEYCSLPAKRETKDEQRRSTFGKMIFSFDSLRDLCAVCRILDKRNTKMISRAFRADGDSFFLVLENASISAYTRLDSLTFILEFGKRERTDHISTYLSEHGEVICRDNAIETLSQF